MDSLITRSSVSIESVQTVYSLHIINHQYFIFKYLQTDSEEQLIKDNLKNLGRSADSRTVVYKSLDLEVRK